MKRIIHLTFCLLVLGCSKGGNDNPLPPDQELENKQEAENGELTVPELIFPEKDQLCLDSEITFNWSDAINPEGGSLNYQIQISTNRAFTGIVEDQVIQGTSLSLVMERGQDYYWRVLAIDSNGDMSDFSPSSAFYVQGEATSNYIPFNPSITSPEQGKEVAYENINLQWESSDLDNDFLRYDVYLGTTQSPGLFESGLTTNTLEVSLEPNKIYYWQVHVSDGSSKSIGGIWSFTTK